MTPAGLGLRMDGNGVAQDIIPICFENLANLT
jgi:hypothetical protein